MLAFIAILGFLSTANAEVRHACTKGHLVTACADYAFGNFSESKIGAVSICEDNGVLTAEIRRKDLEMVRQAVVRNDGKTRVNFFPSDENGFGFELDSLESGGAFIYVLRGEGFGRGWKSVGALSICGSRLADNDVK